MTGIRGEEAAPNIYRMEPVKKTVNERLRERLGERDEVINALVNNERINRGRIEAAEVALAHVAGILGRDWKGRIKWLILGK